MVRTVAGDLPEQVKNNQYVNLAAGNGGQKMSQYLWFTVYIAEVGDIRRFDNPKQLQKLTGYAIVADSSGKHNGESRISHRGRKRLRYALYEVAISVIGKNKAFREIHDYYRTRKQNPLKKMQSVIAIACKLIRIFYTILTKGVDYDGQKMLSDIVRPETIMAA